MLYSQIIQPEDISSSDGEAYDVSVRQTPEMVERGVPPGYNLKMLGPAAAVMPRGT